MSSTLSKKALTLHKNELHYITGLIRVPLAT